MRLENGFEVPASVEQAWRLLNDVPSVVPCMPGAELVEVVDENAWKAKLHVKLGPIALQFLADVAREQMDEAGGASCSRVKAREAKGRGSAEATIESTLAAGERRHAGRASSPSSRSAAPSPSTDAGVVADVASRLTAQFADCIARKLADARPARRAAGRAPAPIGGLRLVLGALWRSLFRRSRGGE